ncbi:MAG: hypothetical protein ACEY3L_14595 [Wolbachia sp.]|uniref:hypothetical protein n=1 Tax=unclassified Wolbachia TaxID=2640676 RepID=UPI002230ACF4|nr:hypothetical protein [Wolbachia endosymbiont (group A) of Tiphia femorata]
MLTNLIKFLDPSSQGTGMTKESSVSYLHDTTCQANCNVRTVSTDHFCFNICTLAMP